MIILSPSLVLPSPGADYDLNSPLIGYDNQLTAATIAAGTAAANYPASNLANPNTASKWLANDTTTQYVTWTPAAPYTADYLAIAKHNLFTVGATVSVEVDTTGGGTWVQVTTPQVLPDNGPTLFRFQPQLVYAVRLKLTGNSSPAQISVMYVGKLVVCPRHLYVGFSPLSLSRQATVTNGRSESGNFLGRIVTGEVITGAIALTHLTAAWYRTYLDPFIKVSRETPFFFVWRPADYPLEMSYCWMTNSPVPANAMSNGMMSINLQVGGISA